MKLYIQAFKNACIVYGEMFITLIIVNCFFPVYSILEKNTLFLILFFIAIMIGSYIRAIKKAS